MLEDDLGDPIRWNTDLIESNAWHDHRSVEPVCDASRCSRKIRRTTQFSPTIAVVHIDGVIMDGDSTEGGLFGSSSAVGSRTIRGIMKELEDDDDVKGVVIRINSPGGSATASEVIWRAARDVAEDKPVYVSVGNYGCLRRLLHCGRG